MGKDTQMKIKQDFYVKTTVIIAAMIFLIAGAKIVRYTIMKDELIANSIGHGMIGKIVNGVYSSEDEEETQEELDATERSIKIFTDINFFELTTMAEFEVYISILWNIMLLIIIFMLRKKLDIMQAIFLVLTILVLNVFDFNLAKEPVQMLYFVLIYMVITSKALRDDFKYVLCFGILYWASVSFRDYYILIAMFMLGASWICKTFILMKDKLNVMDILIVVVALGVGYALLLSVAKVAMPEEYTALIHVRTRESTARTDIRNWITKDASNLPLFTLDYLIMLVRMMVPIELMTFGPKYWPYVAYQVMITFYVVMALKNIKKNHKSKNVALYVYLGFLCGSATFEPDFGSWVRHEAAIAPVLFILADMYKFKKSRTDLERHDLEKEEQGEKSYG